MTAEWRGPDSFRYRWTLRWTGSVYRGRWVALGWRQVWWVPLLITVGPLVPALLVALAWWLVHR